MKKQGTAWHNLAALAVLASCGLSVFASAGADKKEPPKPLQPELQPELVKAWRGAGAEVGHIRSFDVEKNEKTGLIPAFWFTRAWEREWKEGELNKLPDPGTAFGLELGYTKVTDAVFKELAGLKSLQSLSLSSTQVTGVGLKHLAALKSLQTLDFRITKVTDAGLKELAGLTSVHWLDISYTKVTDEGLKELAGLKSLQTLKLEDTQVTDVGLKHLAGLKSLQLLRLGGTKVTAAGVAALRKELPACLIIDVH